MSYIVEKSPLKDGTKVYRLYEHYTDPLTGQKHTASVKLKSKSRQAVNAAQRELDAVILEKLSGTIPGAPKNTITIRQLCDLWIERQKKDRLAPSTITRNKWAANMLCDLLGGNKLVHRLNAQTIKFCLERDNPAPGKFNERLTRLRALIHFAYEEEYLDNINFLIKVKKKQDVAKIDKLKNKFLEQEEVKNILSAANNQLWHDIIYILTLTGMRIGELIALEVADVDLEQKTISISKTLETVPDVISPMPKTSASIRRIAIQKQLYGILSAVIKRREIYLAKYKVTTNYLFFNIDGGHINYFSFNKYLKELSFRVIGRSVTPHVLRHTYVALSAAEGIPLDVISRRLGHSSSRVTEEIYYHITEKQREKDRAIIDNVALF